jgi:hypothetical protein
MHKTLVEEYAARLGGKLNPKDARMAKLVDALDLGSSAARRESSSLSSRTIF